MALSKRFTNRPLIRSPDRSLTRSPFRVQPLHVLVLAITMGMVGATLCTAEAGERAPSPSERGMVLREVERTGALVGQRGGEGISGFWQRIAEENRGIGFRGVRSRKVGLRGVSLLQRVPNTGTQGRGECLTLNQGAATQLLLHCYLYTDVLLMS